MIAFFSDSCIFYETTKHGITMDHNGIATQGCKASPASLSFLPWPLPTLKLPLPTQWDQDSGSSAKIGLRGSASMVDGFPLMVLLLKYGLWRHLKVTTVVTPQAQKRRMGLTKIKPFGGKRCLISLSWVEPSFHDMSRATAWDPSVLTSKRLPCTASHDMRSSQSDMTKPEAACLCRAALMNSDDKVPCATWHVLVMFSSFFILSSLLCISRCLGQAAKAAVATIFRIWCVRKLSAPRQLHILQLRATSESTFSAARWHISKVSHSRPCSSTHGSPQWSLHWCRFGDSKIRRCVPLVPWHLRTCRYPWGPLSDTKVPWGH